MSQIHASMYILWGLKAGCVFVVLQSSKILPVYYSLPWSELSFVFNLKEIPAQERWLCDDLDML